MVRVERKKFTREGKGRAEPKKKNKLNLRCIHT
jgi:hypothetical protein